MAAGFQRAKGSSASLPGGGGALCINLDRDAPPRIFSVYPKK